VTLKFRLRAAAQYLRALHCVCDEMLRAVASGVARYARPRALHLLASANAPAQLNLCPAISHANTPALWSGALQRAPACGSGNASNNAEIQPIVEEADVWRLADFVAFEVRTDDAWTLHAREAAEVAEPAPQVESMEASSTLKKRRLKMNKHKHRKRLKRDRRRTKR
jgi:hypothetical protein